VSVITGLIALWLVNVKGIKLLMGY
jgi:hypothetical protein